MPDLAIVLKSFKATGRFPKHSLKQPSRLQAAESYSLRSCGTLNSRAPQPGAFEEQR